MPSTRVVPRYVAAAEVAVAATVVVLDLLVPTLVLLGLAALSSALRREGPAALGFVRVTRPGRMAAQGRARGAISSVCQKSIAPTHAEPRGV